MSDKAITSKCGIIDLLESGDDVMADRGFEIQELLEPKGVTLNIPPCLGKRKLLVDIEGSNRNTANCKITHSLGTSNWENNELPNRTRLMLLSLASQANDIFNVCAFLTKFLPPVVNSK